MARALRQLIDQWRQSGDFQRLQALELLLVKGWGNQDVAKFLAVNEQQIANWRFSAMKKLSEQLRSFGLSADVFPELNS